MVANTTIVGADNITIRGSNASRIFVVNPGATLTLEHITVSDGNSGNSDGGAIFVCCSGTQHGALTSVASRFYNNVTSSTAGGGAGSTTTNGETETDDNGMTTGQTTTSEGPGY